MPRLNFKSWFVGERARALAMVLLTRRDDLEIREAAADTGLDYIVSLRPENGVGPRVFGLLVRAGMTPLRVEQVNAQLQPMMRGLATAEVLMPVCIFYFTVKDDHGFYTWAHEPVVEKGQARLRPCSRPDGRPLDDESLEEIVCRVKAWYDALSASLKV